MDTNTIAFIVYGALLWSLGKTMSSPEVARVYVGSFWEEPLHTMDNADLFEKEEKDLMRDLAVLPRQSAVRKINELVKRIRKVKTLAYIISHLKAQMPSLMGKEKMQNKLINDLPNVFRSVLKKHNLAPGDFPDIHSFSERLREVKFSEFSAFQQKQMDDLDAVLNKEIPELMELLPSEKDTPETLKLKMAASSIGDSPARVPLPTRNDKFGKRHKENESNPFGFAEDDTDQYWSLQDSSERLLSTFESLGPKGGFLDTQTARDVLMKTGLSKDELRQIWNLSDIDRDGYFDFEEYVVAMFLVDAVVQKNRPIPTQLPNSVVPPSKRNLIRYKESEA